MQGFRRPRNPLRPIIHLFSCLLFIPANIGFCCEGNIGSQEAPHYVSFMRGTTIMCFAV